LHFVENKQSSRLYLENIEKNYINIGISSTNIGALSSIDNNKVIKTGGVDLTTLDLLNKAVNINGEVRRIDVVEDSDIFYTSIPFLNSHSAGEDILIDFSSNDNFMINVDNFGNSVQPTDLTNNTITFESCDEFTGCDSVFLYDNSKIKEERKESFITGVYDINNSEYENIDKVFVARLNKSISYIINLKIFEGDLDDENSAIITNKQSNIYTVKLNGSFISSSDYTISGSKITITNDDYLRGYNYISVYHYPAQTASLLSTVNIRFGIKGFDQTFISDYDILESFKYFNWRDSFSSNPNYEFYTAKNIDYCRNTKIKINKSSTITFNVFIGNDEEEVNNISKHIFNYLSDKNNFRLVKKEKTVDGTADYWYNCRLLDPAPYTQSSKANTITYTIEFLEHIRVKPVSWGDYSWGATNWGIEGFRE